MELINGKLNLKLSKISLATTLALSVTACGSGGSDDSGSSSNSSNPYIYMGDTTDENTQLFWEAKDPSQILPKSQDEIDDFRGSDFVYEYYPANENWRASNYTYYWFSDDRYSIDTNGGNEGATDLEKISSNYDISTICAYPTDPSSLDNNKNQYCTTEIYTAAVNRAGLCGVSDWSLPSIEQLQSIYNYNAVPLTSDEVDFFPNTAAGKYLSSTAVATQGDSGAVWCLDSKDGQMMNCNKLSANHIRLVSKGAQQ